MSEPTSSSTDAPQSQRLPSSTGKEPAESVQDRRNRELAVHHAHIIQQRRQTEFAVLATTEELLDFPPDAHADPLHPSEADAQHVKALLQPFQPGDYDALIEERTINRRCGYVLCPRPPRSENTSAKFRILRDRDAGHGAFKIVRRADLEKWCSDACAKRGLYLRVQMLETPAWERKGGGSGNALELYHDDVQHRPSTDLGKLMTDFDKLALERGEASPTAFRATALSPGLVERLNDGSTRVVSPLASPSSAEGPSRGRAGSLSADLERLKLGGQQTGEEDTMETR